jgi:mannose-1-phosphate guanylyltransferase / mannose-6-phosphate isomerase
MEETSRAATPVACDWSDVGSWHAVWELSDLDSHGNAAQRTAVLIPNWQCFDRQEDCRSIQATYAWVLAAA